MIKLIYGTGNTAKLSAMGNRLKNLGISLIGLQEMEKQGLQIPSVDETGSTPLENARIKALTYYRAFGLPVFSCDSGLYFDNLSEKLQPGVHVRTIQGKYLTDEEMIDYYGGLVKKYGMLTARYRNAICLVLDENHIYEAMDADMESERFFLTDQPHSTVRIKGFPLDSMSLDFETKQYFYDLPRKRLEKVAVEDGFLRFFAQKEILDLLQK